MLSILLQESIGASFAFKPFFVDPCLWCRKGYLKGHWLRSSVYCNCLFELSSCPSFPVYVAPGTSYPVLYIFPRTQRIRMCLPWSIYNQSPFKWCARTRIPKQVSSRFINTFIDWQLIETWVLLKADTFCTHVYDMSTCTFNGMHQSRLSQVATFWMESILQIGAHHPSWKHMVHEIIASENKYYPGIRSMTTESMYKNKSIINELDYVLWLWLKSRFWLVFHGGTQKMIIIIDALSCFVACRI